MAVIGYVDDIPVFDNIQHALLWGVQYNLSGYHIHVIEGQTGYMSGANHQFIMSAGVTGAVEIQAVQAQAVTEQAEIAPTTPTVVQQQPQVAVPPPPPIPTPAPQQPQPAPTTPVVSAPTTGGGSVGGGSVGGGGGGGY